MKRSDESLQTWWKFAEDNDKFRLIEFYAVNGLLYKKHRKVNQVVLPKEMRIKVMGRVPINPISRIETENTIVKEMGNDWTNAMVLVKNAELWHVDLSPKKTRSSVQWSRCN